MYDQMHFGASTIEPMQTFVYSHVILCAWLSSVVDVLCERYMSNRVLVCLQVGGYNEDIGQSVNNAVDTTKAYLPNQVIVLLG